MPRELRYDAYHPSAVNNPTCCQYYHRPFAPHRHSFNSTEKTPPTTARRDRRGRCSGTRRARRDASSRAATAASRASPGRSPGRRQLGCRRRPRGPALRAHLRRRPRRRRAPSRHNAANANANANPSTTSNSPAHSAAAFGGGGHNHATATTGSSGDSVTTASKGLKKKALKALPKLAYADAVAGDEEEEGKEGILAECAICLSEFGEREEVRVMPQCGHGFHVACVDTWLRSNSSCPSCRRPIVLDDPSPPKRCRKCEDIILEAAVVASSSSSAGGSRGGGGRGGFLP